MDICFLTLITIAGIMGVLLVTYLINPNMFIFIKWIWESDILYKTTKKHPKLRRKH